MGVAVHQCVARLSDYGDQDLPHAVAEGVLAAGFEATPYLMGMIAEETRAAMHALELLGQLGDPSAAPLLVRLLQEPDGDLDVYAEAALEDLGLLAVDSLLEVFWSAPEQYAAPLVACCAGALCPRVRSVAVTLLERDPLFGAQFAIDYGDASLVNELTRAIDQLHRNKMEEEEFGAVLAWLVHAVWELGERGVDPSLVVRNALYQ